MKVEYIKFNFTFAKIYLAKSDYLQYNTQYIQIWDNG